MKPNLLIALLIASFLLHLAVVVSDPTPRSMSSYQGWSKYQGSSGGYGGWSGGHK